ncbi:MAG: phosphatidylserine decarboxylase [Acidobacteria bacterium]|nr:phosphatidylserine decarboxylase [Acidobacteriota bacterium]MCW5949245.1 phosphatidylserine decarboxylase [Pyrinomonadaceae bacterium]
MAQEGSLFLLIFAIFGAAAALFGLWPVALAFGLGAAFMAFFFRDPKRKVPEGDGLIVSSADGRVTRVDRDETQVVVSVFLSPVDVHINRAPAAGPVRSVELVPGRKLPATNDRASFENERAVVAIEAGDREIFCTQIAGIVARRIVCRAKAGDTLERGERYGLIKFSSRTDVAFPAEAEIFVKVGDRVRGGETVLAKLPT